MSNGWKARFQGVHPGSGRGWTEPATARQRPATTTGATSPPTPAPIEEEQRGTAAGVSLSLEGGRLEAHHRVVHEGESLRAVVAVDTLRAFPPALFDLVAFQVGGRRARGQRLRFQGPRHDDSCTVTLLAPTDEDVVCLAGLWQVYLIGPGTIVGQAAFEVEPSQEWLARTVRVESLDVHATGRGRRSGRSLRHLTSSTKRFGLQASLLCPHGTAGLEAHVCVLVRSPIGMVVAERAYAIEGRGPHQLTLANVVVAGRGEEVAEGEWEITLSVNGRQVARRTISRSPRASFSPEGEILIGGVPVIED